MDKVKFKWKLFNPEGRFAYGGDAITEGSVMNREELAMSISDNNIRVLECLLNKNFTLIIRDIEKIVEDNQN